MSPDPAAPAEPVTRPASQPDEVHRDRLSVIGHMASSIAHELSNPLATITATAQSVLAFWPRHIESGEPGGAAHWRQLREDLELVLSEARRAGHIVHGLLASARQHPPEWRSVSLADVVRRTLALCRHHLHLHNIVLEAPQFAPGDTVPVWSRMQGDANQLQQVLLNLIVNAQQAITARHGYGTIAVGLEPDAGGRLNLTVSDDGPGVPAHLRQRIFEPFYTTKPDGQGTGLGLSNSASIVDRHGGTITVDDRPGGGAVFRISLPSLPLQQGSSPTVQEHEAPESVAAMISALSGDIGGPGSGRRVLLVDDEPGIRRSVGRFLQRSGYRVTAVPTARAAVTALRASVYDAIVTDLRMPGLSGEELYELVCSEFPGMSSRIIFTSGDTMRPETQSFLARCGGPSLQKPYELAALIQSLTEVIAIPQESQARRASA